MQLWSAKTGANQPAPDPLSLRHLLYNPDRTDVVPGNHLRPHKTPPDV